MNKKKLYITRVSGHSKHGIQKVNGIGFDK